MSTYISNNSKTCRWIYSINAKKMWDSIIKEWNIRDKQKTSEESTKQNPYTFVMFNKRKCKGWILNTSTGQIHNQSPNHNMVVLTILCFLTFQKQRPTSEEQSSLHCPGDPVPATATAGIGRLPEYRKNRVFQMLLITLLFRSAPDTSLDDKLLKWNHDWLIKEIICHAKQFQNLCMHIFFILQRGKTAFFSSLNYDILDLFHM